MYSKMGSGLLLDALEQASAERAILNMTDAPIEELRNCQKTIDTIKEETLRRMSW
jgi:DNA-binding GntR family transcriptional regulator